MCSSGGIHLPHEMEYPMPTIVSPAPALTLYQDDAGTVVGSFAVPASATAKVTSVNWSALIQAIIAALPAILAILAAFSAPPAAGPAAKAN